MLTYKGKKYYEVPSNELLSENLVSLLQFLSVV